MVVLVTGSTGLLGANVVRALLARDYQVKVLARESNHLKVLDNLNLSIMLGDVTAIDDVVDAAQGCDIIIHIAADTNQHYTELSEYDDVNIGSVKHVINAAARREVAKVIYVSSAAVFGFGSKEQPGKESDAIKPPSSNSLYIRSKAAGQQLILEAAEKSQIDYVVVNPSFMLGAYDSKPSSGQIVKMSYRKRFVFVPPGGKNFVHVKDVATGICNAIEYGKNGECYLLGNENLTYDEFFKLIGKSSGFKSIYIPLPAALLKICGFVSSVFSKLGFRSSFNWINANILCEGNYYSNKKAVKELNMPLTPVDVAVEDAISWFKETGYVSAN
jgi:dihydroflavonol-4-reductase